MQYRSAPAVSKAVSTKPRADPNVHFVWNREDWPAEPVNKSHNKLTRATYSNVYGKMRWDAPSPKITTLFLRLAVVVLVTPNKTLRFRFGSERVFVMLGESFCANPTGRIRYRFVSPQAGYSDWPKDSGLKLGFNNAVK